MNPQDHVKFLGRLHSGISADAHLEIQFAGTTVAGHPFLPLYREALETSQSPVGAWKAFQRPMRALMLARYFEACLDLPGGWVECGVLRGFSALLMSRVARLRRPDFAGQGLHLVDSFEGLSEPRKQDQTPIGRDKSGREIVFSAKAGHFATPVEHVIQTMREFPQTTIHRGWVPAVLAALPDQQWSFVHLDVDLYEPTIGALEYFYKRLPPGAVIVNDDFGSTMFPGAGAAWREFFGSRNQGYAVLDTGQAIFQKP